MDVHEIEGSGGSRLSDEGDISRNQVCSANLINKDSGLEIVSLSEEAIKRVGELRG